MNGENKKLPLVTKIAYGIGTAGDSIPYNLFFTYFVFYLTNVAGISPAVAGTISSVGIIWDAVTDPVVGYLSDNSTNPRGRRTPYMARSIFPLAIAMLLLYISPFGTNMTASVIYYVIVCILLWTCYTTWGVPYGALGAELTHDYNERNVLRMVVGLCSYPFVALVNSGTMAIISVCMGKGIDYGKSWSIAAGLIAVIMMILCCLSWLGTRKKEQEMMADMKAVEVPREKLSIIGILKEYKPVLVMKQFRILNAYGLIWLIGYTLFSTVGVFVMAYNAGMDEAAQAKFWSSYTIIALICTPIPVFVANKIGKKPTLMIFSAIFAAAATVFFFHGINCFRDQMIWGCFVAFTTSAFWGLFYATVYDCSELYAWISGKRNEGGILAISQFIQKLGGALATWLAGVSLSMFGYNSMAMEQTPQAIKGILATGTIIPAVFVAVSILILSRYKVSRKKFEALLAALAVREEGGTPDTSEFEDIL